MKFKELKTGYPLHVFDRKSMSVESGKVSAVSVPHLDGHVGGGTNFVVDVDARFAGVSRTFCALAEAETAYPEGKVISTSLDDIKREIEGMRTQAEEIIAQVDAQREIASKASALLADIDPQERQRVADEKRFARIEENMARIAEIVQKLEN